MPDILIRNLSDEAIVTLDAMARSKGMSRQDMLREYIEGLIDPYQKALFHGHTTKEIQAIIQQQQQEKMQRERTEQA